MRRVMTVVLPVPAPAMMSNGPVSWVTAAAWGAFSPSRMRSAPRAVSAITRNYTILGNHQGEGIGHTLEADGQRAEELAVHLHEAAGVAVDHRAAGLEIRHAGHAQVRAGEGRGQVAGEAVALGGEIGRATCRKE